LVSIKERYGKVLMPEIELVDLKTLLCKRMTGHFSDSLIDAITNAVT
jgi:primosomal protein N' (replication factor Y)